MICAVVVVGVLVVNCGAVGGLVKVGGVDTEMYRTGHPHACSINLTTFCCRSCSWRTQGSREVRSFRGDYVESGTGFFTLISDRRGSFSSAKGEGEKNQTECCRSLSQQGRFPENSEDAAHLP